MDESTNNWPTDAELAELHAKIRAEVDRAPGWESRWLKLGCAARRLGVTPKTLRRIACDGDIDVWDATLVEGRGQRYSAAEIDQLRVSGLRVHGILMHFGNGRLTLKATSPARPAETIAKRLDGSLQFLIKHGVLTPEMAVTAMDRLAYAVVKTHTKAEREGKFACLRSAAEERESAATNQSGGKVMP